MHPSGHQEALPLQGGYPGQSGGYPGQPGGYPGQPGGPSVVQHTMVNIIRESPKDHIVWSICSLFYANPLCLGLAALIFSVKARDRKMVGDLEGAKDHGSTACRLNTAALTLTILTVILTVTSIIIIANQRSYYYYNYRY